MHGMSRPPHFHGCIRVAMATWMTLTAGACGKGLFTHGPLAISAGDGGTNADGTVDAPPSADRALDVPPGADRGLDVPPGADRGLDVLPGADRVLDVFPSADTQVPPISDAPPGADGPSDSATPRPTATAIIDWQGGDVVLGNARLRFPLDSFASPAIVTLTLVSDDGKIEGFPGPIGPIYSVSKTDLQQNPITLQHAATFALSFRPADASIPEGRVALASLVTASRLWIVVSGSSYNTGTGVVTASVFDFPDAQVLLAPVVSCLISGQPCAAGQTCQGGACQ
jgi:hypothetical protein